MKAKETNTVKDEKHSENDSSDEDEETETVESSEATEENDSCSKNVFTNESEEKTATEKELSLPVDESQENTLKTLPEVSSENIQCENGT